MTIQVLTFREIQVKNKNISKELNIKIEKYFKTVNTVKDQRKDYNEDGKRIGEVSDFNVYVCNVVNGNRVYNEQRV